MDYYPLTFEGEQLYDGCKNYINFGDSIIFSGKYNNVDSNKVISNIYVFYNNQITQYTLNTDFNLDPNFTIIFDIDSKGNIWISHSKIN